PNSQNRCRILPRSRRSRRSRTKAEPFLDRMAMSEVGSFTTETVVSCLEKVTRPSMKGGLVWCTFRRTRVSSSSARSVSTSFLTATPEVRSRFSSQAFWSAASWFLRVFCCCRRLLASLRSCSLRMASSFSRSVAGSPPKRSSPRET
ncbi:hypothetical protein NGA_2103200, partial [Nannochloropsis gaditana CCMP526]|uniref:uncharacterized protein n=1 Tax=Nannochloropsis gaditana (strain CCMP526) TaxID=1093141 RepID=UPI00029F7D65